MMQRVAMTCHSCGAKTERFPNTRICSTCGRKAMVRSAEAPRVRPSWDDYFLDLASKAAARSTCDRAHVGAVLVIDRQVISTGYNGAPRGQPHCDEVGHEMEDGHCVRTVHAEVNAVIQAARHGVRTAGAICYVTHAPCYACAKALVNAEVAAVKFDRSYRIDPRAVDVLARAGIKVWQRGRDDE